MSGNNFDNSDQSLTKQLPKIRGFISGKVRKHEDVDDLVQETVFRTLRSAKKNTLSNPFAYAIQVAKTVIYEHWRQSGKVEAIEVSEDTGADETLTMERNQLNEHKLAALSQIVDQMPPLRKEVFIRRRLEGQPREQIASELSLSVEAVKKHINRALLDIATGMEKRGWQD